MSFEVFLHPKANDFIEKLDNELSNRLKKKIKELCDNPERKGERITSSHYYKIRVGDYRIIYEIGYNEKKVIVLFIGHRSKVYDDFTKLI